MAEVYIDGEKAVFDGEPPATLGALTVLLEAALASNGRVVASTLVDGRETEDVRAERPLATMDRVEVTSLTIEEAGVRVRAGALAVLPGLVSRLDELATALVTTPWSEIEIRCLALTGEIGGLLENAAALSGEAEVEAAARAVAEAAGHWIDVVERRDAAGASTVIDESLIPSLRGLERILSATGEARG